MKSNYKSIGEYIQLVDVRNAGLKVKNLLGLSISKEFIPSVANVIGTNMENYKIIRKNQFACSTMQVRRDKKMPVALLQEVDEAIISQAYPIFEIKDEKQLLPEYLMMWFSRFEFDREACFNAVGGVRGSLEWEDFCDMKLPIPSITKQKETVAEHNVIQNRIALNQQLIQKLEKTAQAIYKQWFVDFEFPDENGKPYKSSGGVMVFNEELEDEIPEGWNIRCIKDFGNVVTGKTPSSKTPEHFGDEMPFVTPGDFKNYDKFVIGADRNLSKIGMEGLKNKILRSGSVIVTCIGSDMGKVILAKEECITNQQMNSIVVPRTYYSDYLYYHLKSISGELKSIAMGGSTMPMLSKSDFEIINILKPENIILERFDKYIKPINEYLLSNSYITNAAFQVRDLLLSKLATIEN